MNYASDLDVLVMQHPEDQELSKGRCISEGEIFGNKVRVYKVYLILQKK